MRCSSQSSRVRRAAAIVVIGVVGGGVAVVVVDGDLVALVVDGDFGVDVDRALPAKQAGEKAKRQPTRNGPAPTHADEKVADAREREPDNGHPEAVRSRNTRVRGKHEGPRASRGQGRSADWSGAASHGPELKVLAAAKITCYPIHNLYNTDDRRKTQEDDMAQPQRRPADDSMPPKLDDDIKRLNIIVPAAWARRVDNWRRHQDDLPNFSEAIRRTGGNRART